MLTHLTIHNYALIDELSVRFDNGLSTITGETGAGKSILLGGLGLILGNRADPSIMKEKERKCIIEAEFDIKSYKLKSLFDEEDLDYDEQTIVRREILPSGKSRAFINDSPVALTSLKRLGTHLIDIHSQHQTLALADESFQFSVIDALAGNEKVLSEYIQTLKVYKALKKEYAYLIHSQGASNENLAYQTHLLEELINARLDGVDESSLEQEQEQLSNVEAIQTQLAHANQLFSEEQLGALNILSELKNALKNISDFHPDYASLFERIQSVHIEMDDLFSEIESEQAKIEANPERLQEVNTILSTLNGLYQKHHVSTVEELLVIQQKLDDQVGDVANLDEKIKKKGEEVEAKKDSLNSLASKIHESRTEAIPKLIKQLEKIVANLGMENARFDISVSQVEEFLANGKDELSFLFSANKGGHFNEIKKAASGGELSRIMLAIKAVLSKYKRLPSIIFDEIDTGVSGEIAGKMGLLMQYMSQSMQVVAITHLPQIASKGALHFKVFKSDVNEITTTNLKLLSEQERVEEIAEMIGGKDLSDTALQHAKELLNN